MTQQPINNGNNDDNQTTSRNFRASRLDFTARLELASSKIKEASPDARFEIRPQVTEALKQNVAGCVESEGSMNCSVKRAASSRYGITIDPEFSITQNIRNPQMLFNAAAVFQTGTIDIRSGQNSIESRKADFTVGNRVSILEKVFPFIRDYVIPNSGGNSAYMGRRFQKFELLFAYFNDGAHNSGKVLYNDILPLVYNDLRVIRNTERNYGDGRIPLTLETARALMVTTMMDYVNRVRVSTDTRVQRLCADFDLLTLDEQFDVYDVLRPTRRQRR